MIRRPPRSTLSSSSAASDVYKRQDINLLFIKKSNIGTSPGQKIPELFSLRGFYNHFPFPTFPSQTLHLSTNVVRSIHSFIILEVIFFLFILKNHWENDNDGSENYSGETIIKNIPCTAAGSRSTCLHPQPVPSSI